MAARLSSCFFVISGFVIAYVTETSERTWKSYLAARASRIYSVAIPGLLLAALLDPIGIRIDPRWYAEHNHEQLAIRLLLSVRVLESKLEFDGNTALHWPVLVALL
jgi:peptidoglycan/LPS O-acetylase OafA/YrhL